MLDQCLSTIPHHQWISKLFGFDFRVEYRPGCLNNVADALSRRDSEELAMHTISTPTFLLYDNLRHEIDAILELAALRQAILDGCYDDTWRVHNGLILHRGKLHISPSSHLIPVILELAHTSGHFRLPEDSAMTPERLQHRP